MEQTSDGMQMIQQLVDSNDIVVFMKGTAQMPQCGFSATVAQIFERLGAPYKDVNVLADNNLRNDIKTFSDWPTIPQIYVKGQFVGGCDIAREMYENGEMAQLLKDSGIAVKQ